MSPPADHSAVLRQLLSSPALFSQHVIGRPLRRYQLAPALSIIDSVLHHRGLTFTVMMSRQAGKNELSAQIEAYLLTLYSKRGGTIVKTAPTFRPQLVNSMLRLQECLRNELTGSLWASSMGYILAVGRARAFFLSASPDSSIVGATANLLLEVDEAQDVEEEKYLKEFRPMGASTNVTTVLYGTSWTQDTLLEHVAQENSLQEAQDGIRRNFRYPWQVVAQENPDYARYVTTEIARMGAEHPLVRTQYLLETLTQGGRFLSASQLGALQGDFPPLNTPEPNETYVAGIDLAGGDEEDPSDILRPTGSRRDSTTITIARVTWRPTLTVDEPHLEVVAIEEWAGVKHRDTFQTLVNLLTTWRVQAATIDASGIGAGVASFLVGALGADVAHPFTFTAVSKSDLGYQLLTAINAGRLKLYHEPTANPTGEHLMHQLAHAKSTLHANQRLSFTVDPRDGHDDLLMSLALTVEAAQHSRHRRAIGRPPRK